MLRLTSVEPWINRLVGLARRESRVVPMHPAARPEAHRRPWSKLQVLQSKRVGRDKGRRKKLRARDGVEVEEGPGDESVREFRTDEDGYN